MAKKYWWEEENTQETKQGATQNTTPQKSYWWDDSNIAKNTSNNIANRVNTWLKNHNSYLSDYQSRYSGRKYSYEDSYVNDSESWLNSVTQKMNDLETERQDILSYIDQNRDNLDSKWLDDILNTLATSRESQIQIRDAAYKDNEWWQSFGKDEDLLKKHGSAEEVYKYFQRDSGYREKYGGQTYDELSKIIDTIGDGEEKEWLGSYASRVDYDEKSKFDMDAGTREIESLEAQREALIQELDAADSSIGTANVDRAAMDLVKRIEEIEAQIQKKKAYMDGAKHIQTLNSMSSVTGNKDFADKSKYVSNVEYGLLGKPEFADNTYAYVNNPVVEDKRPFGAGEITARELIGAEKSAYSWDSPLRNRGSSYEREALEQIKPEEVSIYNYYYATQGPEKAREYLDLLVETFRGRQLAETFEKTSQFANQHPILASAMSVGTSLGSGFEYLGDIIEYGGDKIAGKDAQLGRNESSLITNAVRGTVSEKVDWEIGNWDAFDFVYNTVMSGADSLASTAFGGFGGTVLGLSAAAQGTNDALDRGMSNGQAFWNGLVSGVFEGLFESWSIGRFNALKDTPINVGLKNIDKNVIKEITKNIGKSMLVNATEETLTELANITYDTLVNGEFANYTMEDLKNGAWKQALQQVLEAGASGAFMGMGMSTVGNSIALSKGITNANEYASKNYGGVTDALIQEGLDSDVKSNSYKLATKYQKQTSKGKELTGQQIRNLVSANEAQFAVEDYDSAVTTAKARLTELGETKDVDKVAKLVAKRATGQELTRAEKSTLARSQFGAQIAKEMTTPTVETESGTKAYNAKYKSLEERINEDEDTNIKEIQTSDDSKAYASEAVAKIENITPEAAAAIMHDLDFTKPVGAQLNGIDEAYTYGYHGYSVEDLKAGNFTPNLSDEQMMSAYKLGQSARKISDTEADAPVVKMRTAAEAKLTAEQKTAQQKARIDSKDVEVYFEDGKSVVKFDEHTGKYDAKRKAAVNTAKFLSKLGIGGKYYFFESYENADGVRVYKDANGNEVEAPNGFYKDADGSIHIDLNAGDAGQGTALFTLGHELTHFVKAQSKKQFKVLSDLVTEAFDKTDMSMHDRVVAKQEFLSQKRGHHVSYNEALEEVVADAMSTMLTDGSFHEKIMEIKVKDKGLFNTIKRFFDKMIAKFKKVYEELTPDQRDARDIRDMKDMFDRIQTAFAEALVEASDNFQASQQIGLEIDTKTESASPAVMNSERTWTESDYVQEREKAAKEIAKAIGVSEQKAKDYIDSVNSIAKMIAEDRSRLDYFSSPGRSSFVGNVEYGGSFDFSTLCKKRRLLTGTFTAIQRALPNTALTADEILDIRNRMKEAGLEVSCGLCYVEGSRANMGQFAKEFLKLYKQYYPDSWQPNMADVNTPDGIEWVRINHPEVYEQYEYFWNHYGTLKEGDKNLFASQQKPKLYQLHTEYKGEILEKFNDDDNVEEKNLNGGIRLQSFSDFEIVHLIDTMQIIMDMSRVGLAGQAYTKVPDFAWALGDTGLKINLSLIAKGVDADGKLIFDDVEGMPIADAMKLRDRYSKNVGTILVAFNDEQLLAAMADDQVDFIIPFHRSQWKKSQYGAMGLPAKTKDYTFMQNEKYIKPQYHEYRGRMVKDKATNYMPNEYWDFSKSGKENAEAYLEMCARNNKRPKFYKLLQNNGDGSYSLKDDGSTDGYWKLLIDFKMYDNEGNGSPQMAVKPEFNMDEASRMLNDYKGGHSNFPVAQGIVDGFVKDYKESHKGYKYSDRGISVDTSQELTYHKGKTVEQEANGNERREETREAFLGRAVQTLPEVAERGTLAYGYRQYHSQLSPKIQAAEKGLKNLGIPVVVFEQMEGNKDGVTTIYRNDSLAIPGVGVFIHKDATLDALEIVGHEGYHYLKGTANRDAYNEVLVANIDFASKAVIDYQQKYVGDLYFAEDVVVGSKEWATLMEEICAYITGDIHTGDPKGEVHKFLRDYDAVKAAWDDVLKKQASSGVRKSDRYSERGEGASNRDLLANAFEGITQNSVEYKMLQDYKSHIKELNELEAKLSDLNAEIRKIRFGTEGARNTAKLTELESEAKEVSKEINRYDKRLFSLEASEPLRKVIERERKKEAQKTKAHVEEIQQNKKVRAEQAELRHKIRKTIRDLDKILKHGNKQKNVKEDLQPVVTKALKAADILFTENYGNYDMLRNGIGADLSDAEEALVKTCTQMLKDLDKMPTDGYENWQARQEAENRLKTKMSKLKDVFARERKRLNNTTVSSILGELADAYASLEKSEQSYVQGAYTEAVHNFLKNLQSEVGGTIVKDMTKDQLESVYAAYKMVLTTVRKANQMFNEELKQSREQLGNAVIREVTNAGGVHGLWTKAELAASRADWNNMKPVWVANRIGSETFGKLMNGLFKGQYNFAVDIDEAKRFKLEMDKKYHPRNWDAEKQYKFESSTGKEFSLSLQQIMSVYAFSKREQAYSHLLNGGFVFESNSTVVVDKKGIKRTYLHDGATSYKLNEATLNEIINSLTKEQKAYVDEMQKYLSEVMGAKGNDVSMQLYGIKMFKEQFYFPLRSSGAYMERAKEAEMKKQQGQINLVNSGFTHAVKPEAKNPIILSGFMDVWAEHCNEMSMYHSMVLPMEDFRKVYNYSTVHDDKVDSASVFQTIQDAYGDAATAYIDQLYRELNAGATIDPRETTFKKLISNFKKTAVMLSASVVVQQFSSIGRAYAVIDPKYFIGARVNSDTNLSVVDEMKKYAPVAIIKEMGGFDTGTKGSAKSYIMAEQYDNGERIQGLIKDDQYRSDIMGYLPAKADEITWCAIWEAVKRETKATHPKMDVKSEEFLKLAGERFSEIIEKTQVYDSVLARSANMRSKTGLMQMATSFMAEPTTTVNLLEDAIRSGNKKHMARAFGAAAVSIVLNNALASVVYAMRDDDEDETFIEKYFQSFTSGMIDDINPMSYYPFLKDVYSLFQGYDVERADMSVIADLRDALKRVVSLMGKDTSSMDDDELAAHHKQVGEVFMSLLDAGCSVFGVPLKNVRRDANGIINAFTTIGKDLSGERNTTWLSFWDKVGAAAKDTIPGLAWTKDKAKTDKLYEAIVSGDKSYLARLKSTYKTDSAYQSAVRKALRENDSRIHDAAQAKYEGNAEEYKRIFKEIQKEGKFVFDDIMSAINSEESKIRNGLEPDKATSSYTASDFVEAVAIGNASEAKAMREEIISTKVANGKTKEEAEKEFASNVSTGIRDAYSAGLLDEAGAKNMLVDYAGKDEEEAASKVSYWHFNSAHPEYELSESNVTDYQEFAEPAGIELDVFVQYINGTKNLATKYDELGDVEVTKREQVLEVIDSLPLTWQQKDALYLAAGYSESNI